MKVEVIKKFRDKCTGSVVMTGLVLDISEERFKELNSTKFGTLVKKVEDEKETKKTSKSR